MPHQPNDIASLYQGFGGQPDTYRELVRAREAGLARERWPLIPAVEALPPGVPPVCPGEAAGTPPPPWQAGAPAQHLPPAAAPMVPSPASAPGLRQVFARLRGTGSQP